MQRKGAKKAFETSQALSRAEVIGNTAASVIKAFALFGPPPSPAGIASAASAATLGAFQLAAVGRAKPPEFAGGGVIGRALGGAPDHVTIQADPREGIVSPRGMAGLGSDGLDALNAGGGLAGALNITLQLDGQTLAAAILSPSVKRQIVAELRAVTGAGRGISYGRG